MVLFPIILCNTTTDLYPLTRKNYPKQFVKLFENKSLLQLNILKFNNFPKIILIINDKYKYILINQIYQLYEAKLLVNTYFDIIIYPKIKIFDLSTFSSNLYLLALLAKMYKNNKLLISSANYLYEDTILINKINEATNINNNIIVFGINLQQIKQFDPNYSYIYQNKKNIILTNNLSFSENYYLNSHIYLYNTNLYDLLNFNFSNIIKELDDIKINCDKYDKHIQFFHFSKDINSKGVNNDNSINNLCLPKFDNFHYTQENSNESFLSQKSDNPCFSSVEPISKNNYINSEEEITNLNCESLLYEIYNISSEMKNIQLEKAFQDINLIIYNNLWYDIKNFKDVKNFISDTNSDIIINDNYIQSNKIVILNEIKNSVVIDTNDILLISDLNKLDKINNGKI